MLMPPLVLPSVAADGVSARRRLGRGLQLRFQVGGEEGQLRLEPGPAPAGVEPLCFDTARGVVAFSDPGPLLSLLGECPLTLASTGNDVDAWFWTLFEHHLSPQVRALFGHLRVLPYAQALNFGCRVYVTLGASRAGGYLWLSADSFLALCAAGPWRPIAAAMPAQFQVEVLVTLGHLQLSVAQVSGLRPGDVVMLEQALFQVQGTGHVQVGRCRLQGRIDDETGPVCLTLTAIEETSVDNNIAAAHDPGQEDEPVMDVFGHEPFDELNMTLNVRCGTLNLTLGELRNLAPGAVLGVTGYAPGMAGLYYGDRPIGQGQLVEVDGRLGLQLSRVIFSR
jgi:type III secretion protein Q